MPERYGFPRTGIDIWVPLQVDPASANFGSHRYESIARLAPGITIESAVADAESLIARFGEVGYGPTWLADVFTGEAVVRTVEEKIVGEVRRSLWILFGTVGFVLAIAFSNVGED